jgi:hypothetical protein
VPRLSGGINALMSDVNGECRTDIVAPVSREFTLRPLAGNLRRRQPRGERRYRSDGAAIIPFDWYSAGTMR